MVFLSRVRAPDTEEARNGKFGFTVNNTIGDTPQPNGWMDDWVEFFKERRIGHQLKLARDPTMVTWCTLTRFFVSRDPKADVSELNPPHRRCQFVFYTLVPLISGGEARGSLVLNPSCFRNHDAKVVHLRRVRARR